MAVNITEATAINRLLDWIYGKPTTPEKLREASLTLASSANKALVAGWRPDQIPAIEGRPADSVDKDGNVLSVIVNTPNYCGAFWTATGELLETVDLAPDGSFDLGAGGICDPDRGSNPKLQLALRMALAALTEEHSR